MPEVPVPGWLAAALASRAIGWRSHVVSPPNPQFSERPFAIGTLTGIRCWKVNRAVELLLPVSMVLNAQPDQTAWRPGTNNANCYREFVQPAWERPNDHRFMGVDCTCGFYAYYEECHQYRNNSTIEGVIEGFGRCVVGTRGFRCERAVIRALVRPEPAAMAMIFEHSSCDEKEEKLMRIASKYNVPIFDTCEEMLKHFPLTEGEKV